MSMLKIFDTASTGMSAQSLRLNLVASNMANADSVSSSIEQTYRSRQPVFRAMLDQFNPDATVVGVKMAGVVESQAPLIKEFSPDHPMA
ncbi:MAG: flagellar basal body protein, partial [Gammaproteobacteria bacterium]|nr:flagellar basal body protein [Gammaproteobacteria bacterium]